MTLPCVILAGGLGTRMRPATEQTPKTLLHVAGRPFADRQLEWLHSEGVRRVVYSVGFLGDSIRVHVGDGARFGLRVDYVDEGDRLLGTGGALRLAAGSGLLQDTFFVLNGDSFLTVDLHEVERAFHDRGRPALMTLLRNRDRWDPSNAILRDGLVVLYDKGRPAERVAEMEWIDYGLSILNTSVITGAVRQAGVADLADVMRDLSVRGQLAGYEVTERFYEIGSPEGLRDLEARLYSAERRRA